eukprot:6474383-Amphidinium_carterae.2
MVEVFSAHGYRAQVPRQLSRTTEPPLPTHPTSEIEMHSNLSVGICKPVVLDTHRDFVTLYATLSLGVPFCRLHYRQSSLQLQLSGHSVHCPTSLLH